MNINNIVFKLNEQEKIVIELEESLENVDSCYQGYMNFYRDNAILCRFSLDTIRYYLATLQILLKSALVDKLQLHESITLDIGFLDNEDCQEKRTLFMMVFIGLEENMLLLLVIGMKNHGLVLGFIMMGLGILYLS